MRMSCFSLFDMNCHEWFTNCHKLFFMVYSFMKIHEEFVGIRVFSFDMNCHEWFTNCHKLFFYGIFIHENS